MHHSDVAKLSVSHSASEAGTARSRRRRAVLRALAGSAGVFWAAWDWWSYHRSRSALADVGSEVVAGRNALACSKLDELLSWKDDPTGELHFLLGSCEVARGRLTAAAEAWSRVPPGSAFSEKAIRARMGILLDSKQHSAAERLVRHAAEDPRNDRTAVLVMLVPVFKEQGRIEEAERLIEERWESLNAVGKGAEEEAIKLVRQHVELTLGSTPVEKGEAERLLARYRELHARYQPYRDAVELAGIAEQLGRWFEARGFLTISLLEHPARADLKGKLEQLNKRQAGEVRRGSTSPPTAE
jgi:hypothetical protein